MADPMHENPLQSEPKLADEIGRGAERKLKARAQQNRGIWFGIGMSGLVGWSVALPTVMATVLGVWLDGQFPGRFSWTLTLLTVGAAIGCLIAWFWVKRESRHD